MHASFFLRGLFAAVVTPMIFVNTLQADDWPQFRGPAGQGHAVGPAPLKWSEQDHIVWKSPLDGKGWSSPVIFNKQVWVTTAQAREATPEEIAKRLASNTGNQPLDVVNDLKMRAICLDRETGKVVHDVELMTKQSPEPIHTLNSYASPTPIIQHGRIYCHFGPNGTACVETETGKVLWTNQSDKLVVRTENGAGSTPILWENLLIVHFDGSDRQFIAALHTDHGNIVWTTERSGEMDSNPQLKKSYGTPLLVTVEGKPVVVSPAANWLYAYDPATGSELWKVSYGDLGFSVVPKPVERDGVVYLCTSFMKSQLLAVRYAERGKAVKPAIEWRYQKGVSQMPSPLVVDDLLYFVSDGGILTCVDAETGEMVWSERLGSNYSASPLFADGRIYLFDREGKTHVLKPGRRFERLAENKLDGSFMASPAVADGSLYLRTDKALYRIE